MSALRLSAPDIAGRLNLARTRRGHRGRCPACGYVDTFVLTQRNGAPRGWCASCGDADAIAVALARVGTGGILAPKRPGGTQLPACTDEERTARALACWNGAMPAAGTPADAYLTGRGLPGLAASPALRWRADVAHPEERGRLPAMLALVVNAADQPIAVHRTYLRSDGTGKAAVTPAKASLGPVRGGAIRLDPAAPELVIGEGIETAASAGRLLSLPAWASVSAGNMEHSLTLPPEVRAAVIAADADRAGRRAAEAAARRWRMEERPVRVATPDAPGQDFNDLLRAREAEGATHA